MRVLLLHNTDAGNGLPDQAVRESLERAGHEIVHMVQTDAELERALDDVPELLVAAGGDGTVRRAATRAADRGIPLAILPIGTANNIAKSLGIEGPLENVIRTWSSGGSVPLDLGVVHGDWGRSRFLEGVGGGLIAEGIASLSGRPEDVREDARSKVDRAVRHYRDMLAHAKPHRWTLSVDGTQPVDEELLIVEVLNIRSVGPNLQLSHEVDSSDGLLSVVTAGEAHREQLEEYLARRIEGQDARLCLPTRRARRVEIHGGEELHLDDGICPFSTGTVSILVQPAAVRVLI